MRALLREVPRNGGTEETALLSCILLALHQTGRKEGSGLSVPHMQVSDISVNIAIWSLKQTEKHSTALLDITLV